MMLVDKDIREAMSDQLICIAPFKDENLGTNSYDVTLAPTLRTYKPKQEIIPGCETATWGVLDVREPCPTVDVVIPPEGVVLRPGELYLASTNEYTESHYHVPMLNGKSSIGRLGLSIHVTAGFGDVGFCGHWTMELFVIRPLRIYAGMKIAQLAWFLPTGKPDVAYNKKPSAKYNNVSSVPQESLMHLNFDKGG